ncbi:hybrid sensor histidine kinase/response regulator transcription factor [Olivibacter ginsenosidimutans]|uniref:histidine kinase n=1 Tax=Olivibacter ginsenosidimutans TaxID=1176537 RepID=A0ABP9CFU7_9SPHI
MVKRIYIVLQWLILPLSALCSIDSAVYQQYNYQWQQGLAFNNIQDIVQDRIGFIWIATENGLSRFDGKSFKNFKYDAEVPHGLLGNYIQALLVDQEGTLWVSSRQGISKYNSSLESFTHYPILASSGGQYKMDVGCIAASKQPDILWISANGLGIYRFHKKTGTSKRFTTHNLSGLRSNMITALYEDHQGWLWVGTQNMGLTVYRIQGETLEPNPRLQDICIKKPYVRIHDFYEDAQGNVWVATEEGLFIYSSRWKRGQWFTQQDLHTTNNRILSVTSNQQGMICIGVQDGGGYRLTYHDDTFPIRISDVNPLGKTSQHPAGFTKRSVTRLFFDRDQNLWAGSYGDGLFLLAKPTYNFFNWNKTKLITGRASQDLRFYALIEDVDGNLFIGTDGDGLFKLDRNNTLVRHYTQQQGTHSLSDDAILAAYRDRENQLWFGTYSGGLLRYNHDSDSFTRFQSDPTKNNTLGANDVRAICEDHLRQLWVGTNGGGLNKLNPNTGKFTIYNQQNSSLPSNDIRSMVTDQRGNLIIGTYGAGITYFEQHKEHFIPYLPTGKPFDQLKAEVIYDLAILPDSNLWIATENSGLLIYNIRSRKLIKLFNEKNGLASNTVLAIQPDEHNHCWVSTTKGLSCIDLRSNRLKNYSVTAGLQSGIFNPQAAWYSPFRKQVFFAGTGGLSYFNPAQLNRQQPQREITLTGLAIEGKELSLMNPTTDSVLAQSLNETRHFSLPYNRSTITIHYASLIYGSANEQQFAYRLLGLDQHWNYVGNEQSATYRYLPPGHYTFQVAVEEGGNVMQGSLKSIAIEVLPPWYRTWWAYLLYLIVAGTIIIYYRRHRQQKIELNYQLKVAQLERAKESEIHSIKLNYYTRLSHEFRSTLTLILQPVKELLKNKNQEVQHDPSVNVLYVNTNRLLRLANQALTFRKDNLSQESLNLEEIEFVSLIHEIISCFYHQAQHKHISITFQTEAEQVLIKADREKIEMAIFNLVFNAVKFTTKGRLDIHLRFVDKQHIQVDIADSGCGIDKQIGDKLFEPFVHHRIDADKKRPTGFGIGLWMAKSLIELHGGSIRYESEIDKGTTFFIILPTGFSETTSSPIIEHNALAEPIQAPMPVTATVASSIPLHDGVTVADKQKILIVDDDVELCIYLKTIFQNDYQVYVAHETTEALHVFDTVMPDVMLCDVMMEDSNGIDLCKQLKQDLQRKHIPIILLTAAHNIETKLAGLQSGADDYITKPFEVEVLQAKITTLLKSRENLKDYFFNQVTADARLQKISAEDRALHERCIQIIEQNLSDPQFSVNTLAADCAMSYATLSNRIKEIHDLSLNQYIRTVRLHMAAKRLLSTDATVYEVAYQVGIRDLKYFREQFAKQYGMNPSEYIKQYRKPFHDIYHAK